MDPHLPDYRAHARYSQLISSGRQLQPRERPEPECLERLARFWRHVELDGAMIAAPNAPSGIIATTDTASLSADSTADRLNVPAAYWIVTSTDASARGS